MSLGNFVEFEVRSRVSGDVPSSVTLDHGDFLVMDGLAQLEKAHRTMFGLQGPRVYLTYRWVTRHTASGHSQAWWEVVFSPRVCKV